MKSIRFLVATTLLCSVSSFAFAQTAASSNSNPSTAPAISNPNAPVTRGEFQQMVHDAILNQPDMVMQAVYKLRDQQESESKKQTADSFAKHKGELLNDKISPHAGATSPDVTVIVFFDYHCGYCKKLLPAIAQLLNEDKKVKVIFREFPILSEDSVTASRAALAVNRVAPDKYFDYHTALMKSQSAFNEEMLLDTADKLGIKRADVKTQMDSQAVTDSLEKNRKLGEELSIRGTPALFIGDKMLPGAVPYETIKRLVDQARTGKAGPDDKAPQG